MTSHLKRWRHSSIYDVTAQVMMPLLNYSRVSTLDLLSRNRISFSVMSSTLNSPWTTLSRVRTFTVPVSGWKYSVTANPQGRGLGGSINPRGRGSINPQGHSRYVHITEVSRVLKGLALVCDHPSFIPNEWWMSTGKPNFDKKVNFKAKLELSEGRPERFFCTS